MAGTAGFLNPLFAEARVRRALTMAINRRELAQAIGMPATIPIVDGPFTLREVWRGELGDVLPYDPKAAGRLLDEAGWRLGTDGIRVRAGKRFHFTLLVGGQGGLAQIAVYVQEPDKASGRAGEILLWASDMAEGPRSAEPRSYRVPFSQSLHEKVQEAGNKIRKGLPQLGEVKEEKIAGNAKAASSAEGEQKKVDTPGKSAEAVAGGQSSANIEFYDLPDPLFPEK